MRTLFPDPEPGPGIPPLAERMRPRNLEEFVGQEHLTGEGKVLREWVLQDRIPSVILWGPPGSGKTTLARIMAAATRSRFVSYSAVLSGIKEIKSVMAEAAACFKSSDRRTILFVDEIHRFNKAQQDAFLPYVESGVITLVGATTENPSFEVISALLSRAKVYVLRPLRPEEVELVLKRSLADAERGLGRANWQVSEEVIQRLAVYADGDARVALNALEGLFLTMSGASAKPPKPPTLSDLEDTLQKKLPVYDKSGEEHYNLISALHKSMRNSDPDAALYWLGRMLEGGEDPVYLARRMVRFASEDVGIADVRALRVALDAAEAVQLVGLPECKLALAQAAVYLSVAPKSNSLYRAYANVLSDVQNSANEPPPLSIRNAPTRLMEDLGYGRGYKYAHDMEHKVADMDCLPDSLRGRRYYNPSDSGMERRVREALEDIAKRKARSRHDS